MSSFNFPQEDVAPFQALLDIVRRLRGPGGCPWDQEQTHASLKRNLLEECYEVLEAIDSQDPTRLSEELGDVLVQVAFHCQMAEEAGEFQVKDVLTKINQKLTRRHPHVFGDAVVSDARDVEVQWEQLKQAEGARTSRVEGIPRELPALATAQLMQDRVGRDGFEWDDIGGVLEKVAEEAEELQRASSDQERIAEFGDLLFVMVNLGRWLGIHAEEALRQANGRFSQRYALMENLARQRGLDFAQLPLDRKELLWQEAKKLLGSAQPTS